MKNVSRQFITIFSILILSNCAHQEDVKTEERPELGAKDVSPSTKIESQSVSENKESENWFDPSTFDTVLTFNEGVQVHLKSVEPVFIDEYFLDSKVVDSLASKFNNSHQEALALEKIQFQRFGDIIKRDTNGLYVKLKDKSWKLLTIDPTSDEAGFTFEYYFKKFDFYSIRSQWSEGNGYKLVNRLTGDETNIYGRPYFSSNGDYLVSVSSDIEAGYSANGFELFKNEKGRLTLLGTYDPETWGPFSAMWLDDERVVLKCYTFGNVNGKLDYLEFYLDMEILKK